MNSVLLFDSDRYENDQYLLKDVRAQHILQHLKLTTHDTLHITLVGEGLGVAEILNTQSNSVLLRVNQHDRRLPSQVKVSVGLSRPPTMKKILEHGTTLGVGHFDLFQAQLSEKSYANSKVLETNSIHELICLGLSQSRYYAHLPQVNITSSWQIDPDIANFYLDAQGEQTLLTTDFDVNMPCHFLLGPERGWTHSEREQLQSAGARCLRLAPTTLRVEHALFSLMGQWHLLKESR